MTRVVIFDDGISYFTNPAHIQKTYGRFWDEGIPICLAVTPAIIRSARASNTIPYRVSENKTLCNYLNVMAEQRLVEICIHGYHGTPDEFNTDDDVLLQQKIEEGIAELTHAFPSAELATYVLPADKYSKTAVQLLVEYDFDLCAKGTVTSFLQSRVSNLQNQHYLFEHANRILSAHEKAQELLSESVKAVLQDRDLVIVRNAYWQLFTDDTPNDRFEQWLQIVSTILATKDVTIDTFIYITDIT